MRVDADFWQGRRVLVTGHTGFKGAWLALWLEALGAQVVGLSSGVPTEPSLFELARVGEQATDVQADVRDREAVARAVAEHRPELVFHLAAQPLVRRSFVEPVETYEANVMGTVHVLDAVRRTEGVRAAVVITTDKCYENREWEWPYREDDPMGGFDPYSSSKGAAELVVSAYRRSFLADAGVAVASARAGNVLGGGDWGEDRLVPDVMRAALAGEGVEIRKPQAVRPWQHVLNPLSGYLMLAEALCGPDPARYATAFNFGPPEEDARPVREIVDRLGVLWGGTLAAMPQAGQHPHEAGVLRLDSSRARQRLGWRPVWDLDEGLRAVVDWYRDLRDGRDVRETTLAQIEAFASAAKRDQITP